MDIAANFSNDRDAKQTLVVVFLRGAADGLTLVAPVQDDNYHRFRPRLAVKAAEAVPLDGFFGLHPLLHPLEAAWKEGDLAIVHGTGGESDTRSHFEAQDLMEHGGVVAGGGLARFLRAKGPSRSPLGAVAIAPALPELLSGAPSVAAFESAEEFSLGRSLSPNFARELKKLYAAERDGLRIAAENTFEAMRRIEAIPSGRSDASTAANYDE